MSNTANLSQITLQDTTSDEPLSEISKKYSPKKIRYRLNVQFGPLARMVMMSNMYTLSLCGTVSVLSSIFGGFSPLVWGFFVNLPVGVYCFFLIFIVKVWHFVGRFTFVEMDRKKQADEILDPNQWPRVVQTVVTMLHSYLLQGITLFFLSFPLFLSPLTALAGLCVWIAVFFYLLAFARVEKYPRVTGVYNPNQY
mmetsp:Transcript_5899/g.22381  ORF Transcript_5899/g.22381 Transcript_5899/m.22381 type:complete len:196 (-) Transcript_5899:280-867(-)|eukprot:CAMPEP_0117448672 /NCGR_PEP_ID=MMETSP0759-20121206/7528_1 /TAXON_ID=63605 /ORGANISM="Percolomonas cosmopolitus, Strain WS" /LENGTH=195 /DNA_ID=CAMNT_0005241079 /DNA_START=182 /DNA_END=769 /DNA_ORIENTATION=-